MIKIDAPNLHARHSLLPWISPRRLPIAAAAAALSILIFIIIASVIPSTPNPPRFHIIIDAGSTGTRIHVFEHDLGAAAVMRVAPGLSSYSGDPDRAGESLRELLEFGKGKVPMDRWGETEVRLMATAGMRMVDEGAREKILESCRRVLRSAGFLFKDDWANVISGADEGIYAWVAANYALGTLGGDPQETTGIIELGGASAQVTFVSSEPMPPKFSHVLKFGKTTYNLFSNSFLHFGQNVAYDSLHQLLSLGYVKSSAEPVQEGIFVDPCTPKGYSHAVKSSELSPGVDDSKSKYQPYAVGNFSACRHATLKLLNNEKENCLYQQCHLGSPLVPKLRGRFLATENFFYTTKFFDLGPTPVLSDLMLAGEQFCEEDWSKLKKKHYALDEEILSRYCFSSAYIVALLHDSLGISLDDNRIVFANQVGDVSLEWALGAFIVQRASGLSAGHRDRITALVQADSALLLILLLVSVLLVFSAWTVSRWRKPQLKTVYDLEKGHYIVTRVNV